MPYIHRNVGCKIVFGGAREKSLTEGVPFALADDPPRHPPSRALRELVRILASIVCEKRALLPERGEYADCEKAPYSAGHKKRVVNCVSWIIRPRWRVNPSDRV